MANIGLPQRRRDGYMEKPFITAGIDLKNIGRFTKDPGEGYSAQDVIDAILK
jgi:hypothetical protein